MPNYRVTLECDGVPSNEGEEAAIDITKEFAEHRTHHENVVCAFRHGKLVLIAENDWDPEGLALMDEFSDCISAYVVEPFDGDIRLISSAVIKP